MAENQTRTGDSESVRKRMSPFKIALIILGLVIAFLVLKVALIITGKPTISVDYVAEFNRISKPLDYDPNQNAAPFYKKAFYYFVNIPTVIGNYSSLSPADINEADLVPLHHWLALNAKSFAFFEKAVSKPYYWVQRRAQPQFFALRMNNVYPPDLY